MPNMELITSVTVGSGGAASVTLPATGTIPATYTDLKVIVSARTNRALVVDGIVMRFNGDTTSGNYTAKRLYGSGSGSPASDSPNNGMPFMNGNTSTASTFGNAEIYIPNYAGSNAKSSSVDGVNENNATEAYAAIYAFLWSGTAAITTITITSETSATILEGSTFYLYGISNVTSTTKATGGIVSSDGTYNYHMFPFSGTFTPTTAISADYLVIAGGGGGGYAAGGGGAGGYRTSIGGSPLSLTAQAYTVTIGAGGTGGVGSGGVTSTQNTNGGNSVFSTITSSGGGRGANYDTAGNTGFTGGSGGGGGNGGNGGAGNSGSYSPVEGYAGGSGTTSFGGGGGGAGAVGGNGVDPNAGNGGAGSNSASAWAIATQTGVNGYYAGGGGGRGTNGGAGGLGGGGVGCSGSSASGTAGIVNTGSGGGSGGNSPAVGGNGGSGLVIIRYAI
jgi:hypothetical protein